MERSNRQPFRLSASPTAREASNKLFRKPFMSIFDEKYRVVGVESDRLLVRGVHSGDVLTIINPQPEVPISHEEYPVGKLIALTDPSHNLPN
jgi:hypothetical protein